MSPVTTFAALRTPAVLIERPRLDANIRRMQAAADGAGIRLRPHAKTHKSPLVARRQIEAGAIGICCAKLGEAEVFAAAGISDIRLPYPLQPSNADRVLTLQRAARISFIVDDLAVARDWSQAMQAANARAEVLVKVDVGFHRCGITPDPATAVPFLRDVAALPGLHLAGILSHAGHAYHAHSEEELRGMAESERLAMATLAREAKPKIIVVGARGFAGVTGHGAVLRELTAAAGQVADPHLRVERLSEEHATVHVTPGARPLRPGDRVRVVPNHACVVSNLVDRAWLVDGPELVGALPIDARGRIA